MPTIALIDYGAGNLASVHKALTRAGATVRCIESAAGLVGAERAVLPGVGAFGDGMDGLRARGLVEPLLAFVASGRPLLGICLGMQLLFDESEELGRHPGLGLFAGRVVRFPDGARAYKVPHTGWNQLWPLRETPLLKDVAAGSYAYFNHSFVCEPSGAGVVLAGCTHGQDFPAVVARDNVMGIQFHPEKSQQVGLQILSNFVQWIVK